MILALAGVATMAALATILMTSSSTRLNLVGALKRKTQIEYKAESAFQVVADQLNSIIQETGDIDLSVNAPLTNPPSDKVPDELVACLQHGGETCLNQTTLDDFGLKNEVSIKVLSLKQLTKTLQGSELATDVCISKLGGSQLTSLRHLYELKLEVETETTKVFAKGFLSACDFAVFGFSLFDSPVVMQPSNGKQIGHFHSNVGFILGGGVEFWNDKNAVGDPMLTTPGDIWNIFHYKNPSTEADISGKVAMRAQKPDNSYIFNTTLGDHTVSADRDTTKCSDDPLAATDCWHFSQSANYEAWAAKVKSEDPVYANKLQTRRDPNFSGSEILLPGFSEGENAREIIEPGSLTDSTEQRERKLFYKADIRILDGISVDEDLQEITTGPKATDQLVGTGLPFQKDSDQFYVGYAGRKAITTTVDVAALRNTGFVHVYVGSALKPRGLVKYGWSCGTCGEFNAVMVQNAKRIPEDGLTISSPNPVFMRGDFNTIGPDPNDSTQEIILGGGTLLNPSEDLTTNAAIAREPPPAMIAADSVIPLSNAFSLPPPPLGTPMGDSVRYNAAFLIGLRKDGLGVPPPIEQIPTLVRYGSIVSMWYAEEVFGSDDWLAQLGSTASANNWITVQTKLLKWKRPPDVPTKIVVIPSSAVEFYAE